MLDYTSDFDYTDGFKNQLCQLVDDTIDKHRHQIGIKTRKSEEKGRGREEELFNFGPHFWFLFQSLDEDWIVSISSELLSRSQKLQRDIPISDLANFPLKYKCDASSSDPLKAYNNFLNDLCRWVEILSISSWDAAERAKAVSFAILLLSRSKDMKNYHACLGILMGLLSNHVQRFVQSTLSRYMCVCVCVCVCVLVRVFPSFCLYGSFISDIADFLTFLSFYLSLSLLA